MLILLFIVSYTANSQSTFSGERLTQAAVGYVMQLLGNSAEVNVTQTIKDQYFEQTGVTARLEANPRMLRGMSTVTVEFSLHGKSLKRLEIPLRVRIYSDVPVTVRSLQSGTVVDASQLAVQRMEVTQFSDAELLSVDEIVGKSLKTSLPKGAVLTSSAIAQEKAVSRGERVEIFVRSGAVTIKTTGSALQDAAIGERVRIKKDSAPGSRSSSIIVEGVVVEGGKVVVD